MTRIVIVLLALTTALAALYFRRAGTPNPVRNSEASISKSPLELKRTLIHPSGVASLPTNSPGRNVLQVDEIQERVGELQELGLRTDAKAFQQIIFELNNTHAEIRGAALEAVMQFGSRDAIPVLQELAVRTKDAREKVEIFDAIEYLERPALSEVRRNRAR